jgi:serine/threonine-protein kinase
MQPGVHPLLRFSADLGPDAIAGINVPAVFSPDGTRLLFPARGTDGKQQLATRLLDRPQTTFLAGTEGAADPFFSPDGEWIGYFADGKMKKVSVRGGAVVILCDAPEGRGAAWGKDDNIIATLDSQPAIGLSRVPAAGGRPQAITWPGAKGEATHRWPQILPGGQAVLFTGSKTASNYDDANIEVLSLKTGQTKVVQPGGYFGRYLPGGYLLYVQHGALFGVAFDTDRQEVHGSPALLEEDVAGNTATAGGQFAFSAQGTFVYCSGKSSSGTWTLVWLDSSGNSQPLRAVPEIYYGPRFSPDGKRVAFSSNSAIKVYDWSRDTMMQLTFTTQTHTNLSPVWTPDGKHIVFESQGTANFSLQWIRADGSGEAQLLLERKKEIVARSFSPDGRRLAFEDRNTDIWTLPLDMSDPERPKPGQPELFLRTASGEHEPAFSPDGRWISYVSSESGRDEVFVRPFSAGDPSGSGKWLVSAGGGRSPRWSADGKELFYAGPDDHIMSAAYSASGDSFAASKPRQWSNTRISGELDLAPDGKRFVEARPRADVAGEPKSSVHVTVLLNFFDEVRRRILTGK